MVPDHRIRRRGPGHRLTTVRFRISRRSQLNVLQSTDLLYTLRSQLTYSRYGLSMNSASSIRVAFFILMFGLVGCGYRVTPIVRQGRAPTPNGFVPLATGPCQLLSGIQADYVTNIVYNGNFFFVSIHALSGDNILYQIGAENSSARCSTLPQPAGRLVGGLDGSLTILNRWAGQALVRDFSAPTLAYLVSPTQMEQSLLHESPPQFAIYGGKQLYVVQGPTQTALEATDVSLPDWRLISPVLDGSCKLPLSMFNPDIVIYDDSEQAFVSFLECGSARAIAKSKDFANWATIVDLSAVLPQDAINISAAKTPEGCFVFRWRQQSGTWLAMATCSESKAGPLISGGHSRDAIGIWSGKLIAATEKNGTVELWGYNGTSAAWETVGSSIGRNCASYRAVSGLSGHAAVVCWNLSPAESPSRTRTAAGYQTKDGGNTWTEF